MTDEQKIKQEICEIGDRLYKKGFAAANDGNISYRMDDNRVVCTPTQVSKGFMKPDDLCVVDMEGNQIGGHLPCTSEVFIHLTIMKKRPEIKSVLHCHPPHATAFGISGEPVPQGVLPEVELFLGNVPIAKYCNPGGQEFADTILPFVDKTNVIILANHGVISFGDTVERAYWWTEILDAYCRILMLSRDLGRVNYFSQKEMTDLLEIKKAWGFDDPRLDMENCDLFGNDVFRDTWKETGVRPSAFQAPAASDDVPSGQKTPLDQETLIRVITEQVVAALSRRL
jgi:L-fuculose-phosphate aldolase